mgnify:FL=1
MKKQVLSAALALTLGASLLACGAKSDGNAAGDASAKAEEGKSDVAYWDKSKGNGETLTVLYMS